MRKFRILDTQWHVGHQYEMLKFPFVEWSWLLHYRRPIYSQSIRGNLDVRFEYVVDYSPGRYDAAILHLDQECLHPAAWDYGKGVLYREMDEAIQDIPKIVIMHGTPHYPEAKLPYSRRDWLANRLRKVVGANHLVVNSREAARQWRWGLPIIHGLDQSEWFDRPKQARVVTCISAGGMSSYYDRPFLAEVKHELANRNIRLCHIGKDYVSKSWDDYREFLGSSLVYFNPTRESPMPRARTEAMLSGCCVVTTPHHDASDFIEDGKNGFLVERRPKDVANLLEDLITSPARALEVGRNGRETALKFFDWNRFANDWYRLLKDVTTKSESESGRRLASRRSL